MTAAAWIAYGAAVIAIGLCSWLVDEARAAARLAKVHRDNAERFYDLTVAQCKDALERREKMDRDMFRRLTAFDETGRVPPERKPS